MTELSEANLLKHQRAVGSASPLPSSVSVAASCGGSRHGRRPEDSIVSIVGFGAGSRSALSSRQATTTLELDATTQRSARVSSRAVAVGHGSVRPPSTRGGGSSAAEDDVMLESLQVQLEEERKSRMAMETRLKQLESLLNSQNVSQTISSKAAPCHAVKGATAAKPVAGGRPPRCR